MPGEEEVFTCTRGSRGRGSSFIDGKLNRPKPTARINSNVINTLRPHDGEAGQGTQTKIPPDPRPEWRSYYSNTIIKRFGIEAEFPGPKNPISETGSLLTLPSSGESCKPSVPQLRSRKRWQNIARIFGKRLSLNLDLFLIIP